MRPFVVVLLALLTLAPPAAAHPPVTVVSSGAVVADAFSGCAANCDVILVGVDPLLPHTFVHTVSATHSSGVAPAFKFYLRVFDPNTATWQPIPGCVDGVYPAAYQAAQTCTVLGQPNGALVLGVFEALRPHKVGVVTFTHTLTG